MINVDLKKVQECPECGSLNVIYSKFNSALVCRDCGVVFAGTVSRLKAKVTKKAKKPVKRTVKKKKTPKKKTKTKKATKKRVTKKKPRRKRG